MQYSSELPTEQLHLFEENGFLIVRNVISTADVDETVSEIYRFLEIDETDTGSLYDLKRRCISGIDERGMVPFYHGRKLWENRQNQRIYDAFSNLLGSAELIVSIDRVNVNPPWREDWDYDGFVHFDVDTTKRPIPKELQGILSLSPFTPNGGGFRCFPGFHRKIDDWADRRPKNAHPRFPEGDEFELVDVEFGPGDLLIFDGRLPHGNSKNLSQAVRVAQYITMWDHKSAPVSFEERRNCIENKTAPLTRAGRRMPYARKSESGEPLSLSGLGLRLAGLGPW